MGHLYIALFQLDSDRYNNSNAGMMVFVKDHQVGFPPIATMYLRLQMGRIGLDHK